MKKVLKKLEDTEKLANEISKKLNGGEVIGLIGELGAGKTTFTQSLAAALGVKRIVKSPTFTVLQTYKTKNKLTLCHVDAYRISNPQELEALGFFDYLSDPKTITIIEWADRVYKNLPKGTQIIKLVEKNGTRTATLTNK